jgi:transcriptional regulator with XRE-family HTH domain
MPIGSAFARLCRDNRRRLRLTQRQLAATTGVSRAYIATIESGRANPSLRLVERISEALGLDVDLVARPPIVLGGTNQRDFVHARCSGHVDRRLRGAGWSTAREVEVVQARSHGWIDVLAYDNRAGRLLVIEVKTRLDDIGAVERQLGWYERSAFDVAHRIGWQPRRVAAWLLLLASAEVEAALRANREVLSRSFPTRASTMATIIANDSALPGRGLALIDPASKRRTWLIAAAIDGRRSPPRYEGYADAARRLAS